MKQNIKKIFVTRPSLPPLQSFIPFLEEIWESKWLTNDGQFHQKFERALCEFLGVRYCSLFANGTLALVIALQALRVSGEVITTPFSFVATTHALHWNGIKPVFCDIEENTFNIDPAKIESLITPHTTAILPVHVYGNPCRMEEIEKIAAIYGLKVIYDAAHAFGVTRNGKTILDRGDLTVLSFHATKMFTTCEGGAIISNDESMKRRLDFLKNFGFADETTVVAPGINGKMNEIQAAIGLLQLERINGLIEKSRDLAKIYRKELAGIKGISMPDDMVGVRHNYSYLPILIDKNYQLTRDEVYEKFKHFHIYTRRYFYPLISQFPSYRGLASASPANLRVAEKITRQILCLPIYPELDHEDVFKICELLKKRFKL